MAKSVYGSSRILLPEEPIPRTYTAAGPSGENTEPHSGTQHHHSLPRAQPNTYLVTSGADVGRTVFLRASIQFLRMPEVMADKVYTASLVCKGNLHVACHMASPVFPPRVELVLLPQRVYKAEWQRVRNPSAGLWKVPRSRSP